LSNRAEKTDKQRERPKTSFQFSSVQFSTIIYVRPILIAKYSYHERASSRHRPC